MPPLELIRLSPRGSNPLHINAGSTSLVLGRQRTAGDSFLFFLYRRFCCSGGLIDESEIVAVVQHRPGQPQVLGGDGDRRFPVTASFDQVSRPATEPVLLVAQSGENGAGAHDEQTAQVGVARLGDPAQPGSSSR